MRCVRVAAMALVVLVAFGASPAAAHPLAPASLQLEERAPGVASARFRRPAAAALSPRWPAACASERRSREVVDDVSDERFELDCGGRSLAGAVVGVDGLAARDTIAIVRVRLADGRVAREVLGPSHPRFTVPASTPWVRTVVVHVRLGIDHLLGGLDHLLFVLGLLLVVPGMRARVVTLTAFTVGHSVTLALAVLGVVRVPAGPVEVLIALSLVAVAVQVLEPPPTPSPATPRHPRHAWLLAAGFGLVHGLGFAGALAGAGLPADDLPLALLGFNLGIELGQLALALGGVLVMGVAAALIRRASTVTPRVTRSGRIAAAYAIGGLAAMWCLERTWAALAS